MRVTIDGHEYRLSCPAGDQPRVADLAEELDRTIATLKRRLGPLGERTLAVMAAIAALDRLHKAEAQVTELRGTVSRLERAREAAALNLAREDEGVIAAIEAATERVEAVADAIATGLRGLEASRPRRIEVAPSAPPGDPREGAKAPAEGAKALEGARASAGVKAAEGANAPEGGNAPAGAKAPAEGAKAPAECAKASAEDAKPRAEGARALAEGMKASEGAKA